MGVEALPRLRPLPRTPEGVRELRLAWQKTRSNAGESGFMDLVRLTDRLGLPKLEWALTDDRTLDMLLAFEDGSRPLDDVNWMNLTRLVSMTPSWHAGVMWRGYEVEPYNPMGGQ